MNGILNVYKEKDFTSHDVVAKLRGILKQKKIGHTGTLDPNAVGVLPVCLGNATKLCDLLTDKDKTYETVLKLGLITDTQDMTGSILQEKSVSSTKEDIETAIQSFVGEYHQIPPMYSALKVNGKKLYELAREGKVVERKARVIWIHRIDILKIDLINNEIKMRVDCSKGTYIRTLCHDIGALLGCGGCMKELIRTKVSRFRLQDSLTLAQIEQLREEGKLEPYILNVDEMFLEYGKVVVKEEFSKLIYNGNIFKTQHLKEAEHITKQVRVYDAKGVFIAIYSYDNEQENFKPIKMFL